MSQKKFGSSSCAGCGHLSDQRWLMQSNSQEDTNTFALVSDKVKKDSQDSQTEIQKVEAQDDEPEIEIRIGENLGQVGALASKWEKPLKKDKDPKPYF